MTGTRRKELNTLTSGVDLNYLTRKKTKSLTSILSLGSNDPNEPVSLFVQSFQSIL